MVSLYSTIKMMHGPINIRFTLLGIWTPFCNTVTKLACFALYYVALGYAISLSVYFNFLISSTVSDGTDRQTDRLTNLLTSTALYPSPS